MSICILFFVSGNIKSIATAMNANRFGEVPGIIKKYNKAGGKVLKGLVRRREAEAKLFTSSASSPCIQ